MRLLKKKKIISQSQIMLPSLTKLTVRAYSDQKLFILQKYQQKLHTVTKKPLLTKQKKINVSNTEHILSSKG